MSNFKLGMYVRCPFEVQTKYVRDYLVGQIINIDEVFDKITVRFYADEYLAAFIGIPKELTFYGKSLSRCILALHENVKTFDNRKGEVYSVSAEDKNDLYSYCVLIDNENVILTEKDLIANVDQGYFNPIKQMLLYELNNPAWYKARSIVSHSMQNIENAPYGFETLLGSRTYLFHHQVDTIISALTTKDCRYMLADEVGLGKTIEACTIIKGIMLRHKNIKALLIVPDTLIYQWKSELSDKFWIEAPIIGIENSRDSDVYLISQDYFNNNELPYNLKFINWDILLIDETHRLLINDNLYNKSLALAEKAKNVLLLSATPITKMTNEYHKLLTLLNPERYENMTKVEFDELMEKQKRIRNLVFDMMSDLPDYLEYDLYDDFMDQLNEISNMIKDKKFDEIISHIIHSDSDKGYNQIKLALAYLSEFYQIDQNIIRHRRKEISEQDVRRVGKLINYEMRGSDEGKHDFALYESILDYLNYLSENKKDKKYFENELTLLCAGFSGPDAVYSQIRNNYIKASREEKEYLDRIETLSKICIKENETFNLSDKENILIDYLNSENNKKILIFTGFPETAKRLEKIINEKFNENVAVSFHKNKSREASQDSVNIFQNDENCKYMICDETGGEGRNFQIADQIIHYDLPLKTFELEQRIGRLDRIGRQSGKDVLSVVLCSKNTIEKDIFNIYDIGLNIFNESMCGMEIVFQQIEDKIINAIYEDVRNGLNKIVEDIKKSIEKMKEEVDRERYFDLAKQFDTNKMEIYDNLINYFSDNDGEIMIDTMLSWAKMVGFLGIHLVRKYNEDLVFSIDTDTSKNFNIKCAKNAFYFPPRMDDIIKRSKFKDEIYGTFSRETALKHENLTFFAPGNSMYDGIVNNAMRSYKGRCTALRNISNINLKAFKMIFNIKFNVKPLIDNNISVNMINHIKQYIVNSQISLYYDLEKNELINDVDIINNIEVSINSKNSKHLGKRDNGAIEKFVIEHPKDQWTVILQNAYKVARKEAKDKALLCVKEDYANNQLENKFNAIMARKIYFNEQELYKDFNLETLEILKSILKKPVVELDSIAYVELKDS